MERGEPRKKRIKKHRGLRVTQEQGKISGVKPEIKTKKRQPFTKKCEEVKKDISRRENGNRLLEKKDARLTGKGNPKRLGPVKETQVREVS